MRKEGEYRYLPKVGDVYGNWTIQSSGINKVGKRILWLVKCKCGILSWIESSTLRDGLSKSCRKCAKIKISPINRYFNKVKYQAGARGILFSLTLEDIENLLKQQENRCLLSSIPIDIGTASLDRIDSKKGYAIDNVQWLHKDINFMKNKLSQERFIELCKQIARNKS